MDTSRWVICRKEYEFTCSIPPDQWNPVLHVQIAYLWEHATRNRSHGDYYLWLDFIQQRSQEHVTAALSLFRRGVVVVFLAAPLGVVYMYVVWINECNRHVHPAEF